MVTTRIFSVNLLILLMTVGCKDVKDVGGAWEVRTEPDGTRVSAMRSMPIETSYTIILSNTTSSRRNELTAGFYYEPTNGTVSHSGVYQVKQ